MEIIELQVKSKVKRDFKSCEDCAHFERPYEKCILERCVHAFEDDGLDECYWPKDKPLPEAFDPLDFEN